MDKVIVGRILVKWMRYNKNKKSDNEVILNQDKSASFIELPSQLPMIATGNNKNRIDSISRLEMQLRSISQLDEEEDSHYKLKLRDSNVFEIENQEDPATLVPREIVSIHDEDCTFAKHSVSRKDTADLRKIFSFEENKIITEEASLKDESSKEIKVSKHP